MQWLLFVDAALLTPVGSDGARALPEEAVLGPTHDVRGAAPKEEASIMAYLDMSPVLTALRERPHEFIVSDGWVRQHSSPYRLKAQFDGHVPHEHLDHVMQVGDRQAVRRRQTAG
jgi:hypothetical protein